MSAAAPTVDPAVAADLLDPPIDSRRRFQLLEECRELVVSRLSVVISEALDRMSEELSAAAVKRAKREEQQVLLDAVAFVRQHRPRIELAFRRSFAEVFEKRLFGRGDAAGPGTDHELALVDDDEIRDRIEVGRIVQRVRNRVDPDEVLGVRARLAALLERDWFDEDENPAAPEAVFEALREALSAAGPAPEVRTALLDAFEPYVATNLNGVYSNVNERLKANQILPKIQPRVQTQAGGARPAVDLPAGDRAPEEAALRGEPGARHEQGAPAGAAAVSPDDPFAELMRQISAGEPSARTSAARMLSDPATFAMADLPIPQVEPPLIDALSSLQGVALRESAGAVAPGVSGQLLAQLTDHAREKGSALDQLTVEIVSLVFDHIYGDPRLADVVKQQLLRLQVVAVKAALIDRSFFARRQHPMRRLIDRITELAVDPDADLAADSVLVKGLTGIVDWILENFDSDMSTFQQAMDRLEGLAQQLAQQRAERLDQLTREAERVEALSVAQEEARAEIAVRIDQGTPAFVREFLYGWWARAMAHARVDADPKVGGWGDALRGAELLLWSVLPKSGEDIPRLASILPKLIGNLVKGLQTVGIDNSEREAFFNELLALHTRLIQEAKAQQGRTRPRAQSSISVGSDGSVSFDPAGRAPLPQDVLPGEPSGELALQTLRRGDLVELREPDGTTLELKLSWISPSRKVYILTRFPDVARSLARAELAGLLASGRARVLERTSALDRAIDAVAEAQPA